MVAFYPIYQQAYGPYGGAPTLPALATPTGAQATATSPTALSVTASTVANATGYQLYTSATQTGTYAKLGGVLTTPSYSHTGLSAGQTQWYKWVAVGNGTSYRDSAPTAPFSGTTTSVGGQLAAPTGLTAGNVTATTIPVSASPVTGAAGYVFQLATNTAFSAGLTTSAPQNTPAYTFGGTLASTNYYVRIKALGNGTSTTDSAYSAALPVTTPAAIPPGQTDAYLTNVRWYEVGRGRKMAQVDPDFPLYSGLTGAALLADTTLTNSTATLTKATDSNGNLVLTKTGSGLATMTVPGQLQAGFVCLEVVVTARDAMNSVAPDILLGLFDGTTNLIAGSFPLVVSSRQGKNYVQQNGVLYEDAVQNSLASTSGDQTLYAIITHDYLTMGLKTGSTPVGYGKTTDTKQSTTGNLTATSASVLASHRLGIALSGDGDASVTIKSIRTSYHGGQGTADHSPVVYEDGTVVSNGNWFYFTSSKKGICVGGTVTADQSHVAVYRLNAVTYEIQQTALLFMKRNGRVEGDFSAGLCIDRIDGCTYFTTPNLGDIKGLSQAQLATMKVNLVSTTEDCLTGIHVFDTYTTLSINNEVLHDPSPMIHVDGWYYLAHSAFQTTAGSNVGDRYFRLSKSLDKVTWQTVYQDSIPDYEGSRWVRMNGTIYAATAKNIDSASNWKLFHLDGTLAGTMDNPTKQDQASHPALFPLAADKLLHLGFTTGPDSFIPTDRSYTNGDFIFYESSRQIVEEDDAGYTYVGAWQTDTNATLYSGGKMKYVEKANSQGVSVSRTFNSDRLLIILPGFTNSRVAFDLYKNDTIYLGTIDYTPTATEDSRKRLALSGLGTTPYKLTAKPTAALVGDIYWDAVVCL